MARGLGDMLGWKGNGLYDWFDQNRDVIGDFASGALGQGSTQKALQGGVQNVDKMAPYRAEQAERTRLLQEATDAKNKTMEILQQTHPDLAQAVASGLPIQTAWGEAMKRATPGYGMTADQQNYQFAQANPGFAQFVQGAGRTPTVSTQPQYFRDPETGELVLGQLSSSGNLVRTDIGGLQPLGPGELSSERAFGTASGKAQAQAAQDASGAASQAENINTLVSDLKSHPGLDEVFGNIAGVPQQWLPAYPGTGKADALARIEQLSGTAFLNGRQLLKGGGAITDFESKKAEAAFARLQTSQSKAQFLQALDDFNAAVQAGAQKLQAAATGSTVVPAAVGGGLDLKSKYGLE